MRVMISTVHIKDAVLAAIPKLSPEKIIFLVDTEGKKKVDLSDILAMFEKVMPIEIVKIDPYNIAEIASKVVKIIQWENKLKNDIYLHITEGRKTSAIAIMYAGYARKDMIKGIYYITEEKNQLISLPVLEFNLNPTKKTILEEYAKGNKEVKKLAKIVKKTEQMIYQHVTSMKKEGYISDKDELTEAGRIVIL
jgi:CRISPR locus-related DNA-binding protein